jgi:hypothetical protein
MNVIIRLRPLARSTDDPIYRSSDQIFNDSIAK